MTNTTVSGAKARARLLMSHLAKSGITITLAQALEALSATENGTDWNRYHAALKANRESVKTKEYPPHRIIACRPGSGASAIVETLFCYEASNCETIPLLISLYDLDFPELRSFDTVGWLYIYVDAYQVNNGTLKLPHINDTFGIKGIVITIVKNVPEGQDTKKAIAETFNQIIEATPHWSRNIASKIGTVFIRGLEEVDTSVANYYDRRFPVFMSALRRQGGNQQLVVMTGTDISEKSLYESNDNYKLIKLISYKTDEFYADCPLDTLSLEYNFKNTRKYMRIFCDDDRRVEDASLYIGWLNITYMHEELVTKNQFSTFVQQHMLSLCDQPRLNGPRNYRKR